MSLGEQSYRPVAPSRVISRRDLLFFFSFAAISSCERSAGRRIGVVPKATGLVFWQSVHAGAMAGGLEADVEVVWQGPATETEYARQVTIVDSMINSRVDGIVVAPTDATALVSVVAHKPRGFRLSSSNAHKPRGFRLSSSIPASTPTTTSHL